MPAQISSDFSGGVANLVASRVFARLGVNAVAVSGFANANVVGGPARANLQESLERVGRIVPTVDAAFGCVVGPTGEDVQFVDDRGEFVDGDFLTALLAESILAKHPGADILYDVRASRAVPDTVARAGGTAHVNRVGHAFFKSRMREQGGVFGGEVSGH